MEDTVLTSCWKASMCCIEHNLECIVKHRDASLANKHSDKDSIKSSQPQNVMLLWKYEPHESTAICSHLLECTIVFPYTLVHLSIETH